MVTVNVREAKALLFRLLVEVESGEEFVITRNGRPVARLVPCGFKGGRQKGRSSLDDERFFEGVSEGGFAGWEGGG